MSTHYAFVTRWQIKAPLASVWDAIYQSLEWPQWWKGVVSVETIEEGDKEGVGGVRAYRWQSKLPYQLSFQIRLVAIDKYRKLTGAASGELEGTGEWLFEEKNGITFVQYHWNVVTTKPWMNYFSFLLKPLFRYNHNVVMRWGAEGLARKLHAALISC